MSQTIATSSKQEDIVTAEGAGTANSPAAAGSFVPPTIYSETVAHIGSFEVRNSWIMSIISVVFFCVIAWRFFRKYQENIIPSGLQNLVEVIVEGLYDFFHSVTQDHKQTRQFFGICATIFLYIVVSNWFGLLPGVGPVGLWEEHNGHTVLVPLLRSTYSDVNMTLGIAIISVVMTTIFGFRNLGAFGYLGKFFVNPFRDPIGFGVGLLEIISEISKIISFSFRLYGNIFAGEVLLAVIGLLMPFIAPLPFYGLELFVGLVQGLVFSLLTIVFFKMGSTGHGDHEEGHSSEPRHATATS